MSASPLPETRRGDLPPLAVLAAGTLLLAAGYALLWGAPLVQDELFHYDQIRRFLRGEPGRNEMLTTLPGFHLLMAGVARTAAVAARLFGAAPPITFQRTPEFLRGIQLVLAVATGALFYGLARRWRPEAPGIVTLQFLTLPLLYPFFFLLYTDVLALLFVLASVLLALRGRPAWAGAAGTLGIAVRQTNVVWLAFVCGLVLIQPTDERRGPRTAWTWLRACATALGGLGAFAVFVVLNRGIAVGDQASHEPGLHLTNVWVMLALVAAMFLPAVAEALACRVSPRSGRREVLLLLLALAAYWITFVNTHPYNARADEVLRNALLVWGTSSPGAKLLLFLPVGAALLWIGRVSPRTRLSALLAAATLALLVPTWLVEPRYYIVPVTLWLLVRPAQGLFVEAALVVLNVGLSLALLDGIRGGLVFP